MKVKKVAIFSGDVFDVPQGIQRIDSTSTHGWQVRYQGTKMFSDGLPADGSGAGRALVKATRELLARIAAMPAPVALQRTPSAHKTSNLPSGISGPIVRTRAGSNEQSASLSVLLPQFGGIPKCTSVYIGNPNTYTVARYRAAVRKAITLRQEAEVAYELAATKARRKAARGMRAALREGAAAR
jgi:hypothetical protein